MTGPTDPALRAQLKVHKFVPLPSDPERCKKCGFLWASIAHKKAVR